MRKLFINPWSLVTCFGIFGGKSMGTLDAIDMLSDEKKLQLTSILEDVANNALILANRAAESSKDDLHKDHMRVMEKFRDTAAEFRASERERAAELVG